MPLLGRGSAIRPAAATARSTAQNKLHDSHAGITLELPPRLYTIVWIAFVSVSTCNALLATIFAAVYYAAMTIRGGYLLDAAGLLPAEDIPVVLACYLILAVFFWKTTFQAIFVSIRARRLLLRTSPVLHGGEEMPLTYWQLMRRKWTSMIPNVFETVFLAREITEVSTQSYQAYKSSKLISQQWINNFYVVTLALNCWISPLIHVRTRHQPALQRFLYLCSDVVLDFASTSVIPVCIIFSVLLSIFTQNLSLTSGDMEYAFDVPIDDVSFIDVVKGVQQVFVVTWFDFFTKMLPFLSMSNCLDQIKQFVQRQPDPDNSQRSQRPKLTRVQAIPKQIDSADATSLGKPLKSGRQKRFWSCVVSLLVSTHTVHALLGIWGCCVVGFHTQAWLVASRGRTVANVGCKSSSQPWFVDQISCTTLDINCHRHGFVGEADEIAAALSLVNPEGVTALILSHCPRLHVPPQIQTLTNLMWFEIYNATLFAWDEDAALVQTKFPALQYLSVLFVNTSAFPIGLQSSNFPVRLRDITVTGTNLTTLPSDLHTKWTQLINLILERNNFQVVPQTVAQMSPERFSLLGNSIEKIPDGFYPDSAHFAIFSVAKNPITSLPSSIGSLKQLYLVLIDYTEIQELPAWLVNEGQRRAQSKGQSITVSAGGSRLCREHACGSMAGLIVVCREKADEEIEAYASTFFRLYRQP